MLELVVAIALSAIALFLGATLLKSVGKQTNNAGTKFTQRTLLATISGSLQKYLASGDLRFFAFSGLATPNRMLARAVLPLPAQCGDFASSPDPKCAQDVGLVYVHYDKLTTPTTSVLCNYQAPTTANRLHGKWLVDLRNDTYGPPTLAAKPAASFDGFDIVGAASAPYIRGAIRVEDKQILALMNPPLATLWVASGKPTALLGVNNTDPTASGVPGECLKSLKKDPGDATKYLVDKLYTVEYTPLVLSQFTNGSGSNIDPDALTSSQGVYPLRLFSASFRSVGRRQVTPNNYEFAFSPCDVVAQAASTLAVKTTLVCSDNAIATVPGITQSRIEEVFQIKLNGTTAERFEVMKSSQTLSASCGAPLCQSLPIAAFPGIPSVSQPGGVAETFENFDSTAFSLLKQEAISRLRFKLIGSNGKEDTFDIVFP